MPAQSSVDSLRDSVLVRGRWRREEWLPFDEIASVEGARAVLRSGRTLTLSPEGRTEVCAALAPPEPTGAAEHDAAAWASYLMGPWSPRRAARALLTLAQRADASDVHLEPDGSGVLVRGRRLGRLETVAHLDPAVGTRLIAALKDLAGCLPYRSDIVQEGRIPREGVAADVRASFIPTALGERAALRLFGRLLTLPSLGLPAEVGAQWREWLGRDAGLLLVAGPSGGGKTTTVYASLGWLAEHRDGAHLSIEDPVEHRLRVAGIPVDQVELDPSRGLTAEAALDGALRQDVDVLALAEIRRPEEAALALRAAHTGRLVLAGVHAGSGPEARRRLLDLGVEEAVLDDTLIGVLHQRLETGPCGGPSCGPSCACGGAGRLRRPHATTWSPR